MRARLAEDLTEEFGCAVDDAGLAVEAGSGGDETDDLDHPGDGVDADQRVDGRQRVERADRASALASSGVTSPPTLPAAVSSPATIGS